MKRWIILIGVLAGSMAGCNRPIEIPGEIFIVTQGGQSIPLALVDVRIYEAAAFDSVIQLKARAARDTVLRLRRGRDAGAAQLAEAEAALALAARNADFRWCGPEYPNSILCDGNTRRRYDSLATPARLLRGPKDLAERHERVVSTPAYWVEGVQAGAGQVVQSGADGHFRASGKVGQSYVVVATTNRQAAGATEWLHWMVRYAVPKSGDRLIRLSNHNIAGSGDSADVVAPLIERAIGP